MKTMLRRVPAMLTLVALLTAPSLALANSKTTSEGFELSQSTWTFAGEGSWNGAAIKGSSVAHSGSYSAWLSAQSSSTWSSVGVSVKTGFEVASTPVRCTTEMYAKSTTGNMQVNLEVFDPLTWQYLALKTVTLTQSGWTRIVTPEWIANRSTAFVRIAIVSSGGYELAYVDDMRTSCQFY